jgi:hypothetical protein
MKKYIQVPPILFAKAAGLWLRGCVHFPKDRIGLIVKEKEDFIIFRKVVVDPTEMQPINPEAIFKVYFRFVRFSPDVNKILSLIPIPFIIAQPGFRSKTWLFGKETNTFYGLYKWDSVEDAKTYWNSFPLKLMIKRAVPNTLRYEIIDIKNGYDG